MPWTRNHIWLPSGIMGTERGLVCSYDSNNQLKSECPGPRSVEEGTELPGGQPWPKVLSSLKLDADLLEAGEN